jgi:hypothetical protein
MVGICGHARQQRVAVARAVRVGTLAGDSAAALLPVHKRRFGRCAHATGANGGAVADTIKVVADVDVDVVTIVDIVTIIFVIGVIVVDSAYKAAVKPAHVRHRNHTEGAG